MVILNCLHLLLQGATDIDNLSNNVDCLGTLLTGIYTHVLPYRFTTHNRICLFEDVVLVHAECNGFSVSDIKVSTREQYISITQKEMQALQENCISGIKKFLTSLSDFDLKS